MCEAVGRSDRSLRWLGRRCAGDQGQQHHDDLLGEGGGGEDDHHKRPDDHAAVGRPRQLQGATSLPRLLNRASFSRLSSLWRQVNTGSQQRSERGLRNEVDKDGKALKKKREHTIYTPDGGEHIASVLSCIDLPDQPTSMV